MNVYLKKFLKVLNFKTYDFCKNVENNAQLNLGIPKKLIDALLLIKKFLV